MTDPSLSTPSDDPKESDKIFPSLSVKNQLDTVLQARGKERLRYVFLSEHPEQLIQALPELEVFLTVKEAGERDCLDLIALTTPEQFQYLLDLDLWKRDQLDPEKVFHWMEILLESGEKKTSQFIQTTDIDFIALLLKKFLHVTTIEGEHLEGMDRLLPFTLDQYHFIHFKGKRTREIFEPFLRILYTVDRRNYQRLMDSLIVEFESELEETGYRFRNCRLADYGFPDFEEALEIYRFINPDSFTGGEGPSRGVSREEPGGGGSFFYLTFRQEGPFFSSILSRIEDASEQDRLKQEIAAVCNKAMVAEAIELSNLAAMERVIKKVYHTLNLGLEYLGGEDERKSLDLLRSLPIQKLFQYGMSTTLLVRRKAESILGGRWFSNHQENLVFLDSPHFETFEGILRRRPVLYRNGVYEDFSSVQDLRIADDFLEFIETVIVFLEKELNLSAASVKGMDLSGCAPEDWREITFSVIFLTATANRFLKGVFQFEAVERGQVKEVLESIFLRDAQGKGVIKMEVKKRLRELLESIEGEEGKRQHLLAFRDFCLDLFEAEYGKIPSNEEVDPRFAKGLLIKK